MKVSNDDLIKLYGNMWLIRMFEQRAADLFAKGVLPGFIHLGVGQEAFMAGTHYSIKPGDSIGTSHREHGLLLLLGITPGALMAELYGKATGSNKGKGGSMHACLPENGALGCNGILGSAQTIINGYGFAHKVRKTGNIAVTIFGDGAANRGDVHEGMNLASVMNLPVVFIIVDNGYGISMSSKNSSVVTDLSARAAGYGMPGVTADGNDVLAVIEATSEAFKRAREGGGPSVVEFKTYRHRGHFEGDPTPYRSKEELEMWMKKDPILRLEKILLDRNVINEKQMKDIKAEQLAIVDDAQKFAEVSPYPEGPEGYGDVFYKYEGRD
ncbi:MAG TPA: pyruvate dehydrogenase (acetyl-transferring) E1 component subunit alpha [Clostridiales bacterium]|nr:pyruvate dehydrogenase (acetyl-transferring) E1 component subunit alpha [Clostridiales bacterium]